MIGIQNTIYCYQFGNCNNVNVTPIVMVDDDISCYFVKNNKIAIGCKSGQMYFFGKLI